MNTEIIGMISLIFMVGIMVLLSGIAEMHNRRRQKYDFMNSSLMEDMAQVAIGCSLRFLHESTDIIPMADYDYAVMYGDPNTWQITDHYLVTDPNDAERRLTIFLTDSPWIPVIVADESNLVEIVDAIIHAKENIGAGTADMSNLNDDSEDDAVTATNGHIDD